MTTRLLGEEIADVGATAKALATAVSGSLAVGLALAAAASANIWSDNRGVVERIVDGDTLIATVSGESTTIRLLNIDTPEIKDPKMPVQCLGHEASEWLAARLPAGTNVDIEYDQERTDRYGRTLAGVYEGGALVNAQIAREGLGVPVYFAPNDKFLEEVEAAHEDAKRRSAGLYDSSIACTLPGQVAQAEATAETIPTEYAEGISLEDAASKLAAVAAVSALLQQEDLGRLGNAVLTADRALFATAERTLQAAHGLAAVSYEGLVRSEAEHRAAEEAAKRAEAERLERERIERERREAAERAEKERAEREAREAHERVVRAERVRAEQAERDRARAEQRRDAKPAAKKTTSAKATSAKSGKCVPYGPEIPYSKAGGYTGKRYGMPGGKTFRKCS